MTASPPRMVRFGRLLRPGRNPLARGADRLEGAVVLGSVLLALVLVPVMLTLGSATYASLAEESVRQTADRYETVAVLTQDAPAVAFGPSGEVVGGRSEVPARWLLPAGAVRTGAVTADDGMKAGAEVSVWLDDSGSPVAPPMSTTQATAAGVLVAVAGWSVIAGLLALGCWGLHHALNRRRYRAWAQEWARLEPDWHDRRR